MSQWSDPTVIIAACAAGVALLYTILTGFIWYATWQNTRATKNILEAAQRPYLAVRDVRLVRPECFGGAEKIAVTIANVGSIPSREVDISLKITYLDGIVHGCERTPDATRDHLYRAIRTVSVAAFC
jgi:hypothetical protein